MIHLPQMEFGKRMKFGAVFAATFVAELQKSSYFFCLCYYIVKSGEDRQQNMLCSVPFYYYGMYVYVG